MVIASRNPVHSVLFLILAFVNAAGLFVLLGAEFLAMILVVVYVGAVAVLFLFVVMMLDVDFAELRAGLPAISAGRRAGRRSCLLVELLLVVGGWAIGPGMPQGDRGADPADATSPTPRRSASCSTRATSISSRPPACAAGRDDRRHRADAAPQGRRQAPEHRRPGRAHTGDGGDRRSCKVAGQGQGLLT